MEKIVEKGILYDFYGSLLTQHQRRIYEQVVYDDMSLNEISEAENISKQAVSDLVKRTTNQMQKYEEKLQLIERTARIKKLCSKMQEYAKDRSSVDASEMLKFAEEIKKEL